VIVRRAVLSSSVWALLLHAPEPGRGQADEAVGERAAPLLAELTFETPRRGTDRLGTAGLEAALGRTRVVRSPVRNGRASLEVSLDRASGEHRTDFYLRGLGERSRVGGESWYGFSVRFPEDWEPDTQNELFAQWVRTTETPSGPQLALYVIGEDCVLRKRWDRDPDDGASEIRHADLWRGSLLADRGRWIDWVLRVRWSKGADGSLELWKDGTSLVRDTGPNCYNDGGDEAPYFKFGIYKWPWAQPPGETPSTVAARRLHFDEIRVGDASASFEAVSPRP